MKELSILFVDSVNDSLLNNFKDEEQIKDYFEINKFKASKKEMLLVPKLYLKNEQIKRDKRKRLQNLNCNLSNRSCSLYRI